MLLSFAYLAFSAVLRLLVGGLRSEFAKDIELLVLRRSVNPGFETPQAGLPTQDRQFVSQHQDLQLLRARPGQQPHEREQITDSEIDKRPQQAPASHS